MIYVSTGGIRNQSGAKTAQNFYDHGIMNVELSGGAYSEEYQKDLLKLPEGMGLQVHNYFPPPKDPFVFNLATADADTAALSLNHVRRAVELSLAVGNATYAFHAGFRIDPKVNDLGQTLRKRRMQDRDTALEKFAERVMCLALDVKDLGVTLLIENNVLSPSSFLVYGENPLLLCHPDEITEFMSKMPSNVGLLLDVAHLKVSSNALDFNLIDAHEKLAPYISAYHLSDNDGTHDKNEPVREDSWFWPYIKKDRLFYTLEIYNVSSSFLFSQYQLVNNKLSSKCT